MSDLIVEEAKKSIAYIISEVADRGWTENQLQVDGFLELRKERRFREAQVAALYEQYFLPERHEFEWEVLSEIVNAITASPAVKFAAISVAGGVIGSAAYDLLTTMCSYAATQFQKGLREKARQTIAGFKQLGTDAEKLKSFFSKNHRAKIEEIEQSTGLPRERIYPLMKLAGFNHYRRANPCYWEMPQ